MNESFQILAGFLERFSDEVEGRSLREPSRELKLKLQQFARGTLAEAERDPLILHLKQNPQWIPLLAAEAKAMRRDPGPSR